MQYRVRNDQEFGPYTLEELQRYVQREVFYQTIMCLMGLNGYW